MLVQRWQSSWQKLGLDLSSDSLFESLLARYSEPHRRYHTVQHLDECFSKLDELQGLAAHPGEVEIALWFHDAVYDVRRNDNEERSAQLAAQSLADAKAAAATVERVHSLIMATRHHELWASTDEAILLDVDLSILGAPPQRFEECESQIREEYRHVPAPVFNMKRRSILESLVKRPRIYNTQIFFERYEAQARANLAASLARLG